MKNKLTEIDIKVIKFLLTAGVYSDLAIVKNLGITYEELDRAYENLLENGYLQSYSDYKKENLDEENCNCSNKNCGDCSSKNNSGCGGCCNVEGEDLSEVRVITWKAIQEFDN